MYIVEGNIGVGKTTFLSKIKVHPAIEVVPEPLDDWNKQEYGQSLLANFYQNTPRWAYTLETLTMICRTRDHILEQSNQNPNRVFERSIYSGHYCFARNSFETGNMSEIEWNIYNEWASFLLHKQCRPPLGFIYLKADPEVCFERVQKRNRSSEKSLTLEYIKQVDYWHNHFLVKKEEVTQTIKQVPVLVLDCNEDFSENESNMRLHLDKISTFLERTQAAPQLRMPHAPQDLFKHKQ